jgi:hypothetical protein
MRSFIKIVETLSKPYIDWHMSGPELVWIDMMSVPEPRQGVGQKYYKRWQARLPKTVRLIRLMAVDTGGGQGPSHRFWEAMGFDYTYDGDALEDRSNELRDYMWKGINGHPTPPSVNVDEDDELTEAADPQKHYVGSCVDSFDDDGNCHLRELPWSTVSDFAVAIEHAQEIDKPAFLAVVTMPENLWKKVKHHENRYLVADEVYMLHDETADVHYFFN